MKLKIFMTTLIILTISSCAVPVDVPPSPTALPSVAPQPALIVAPTFTPIPALTQAQPPASTAIQPPVSTTALPFCDDPRTRELINSFSTAIASKDGPLLASLVSPATGVDVKFYRDGNVVIYDVEHAKFVFETFFDADWGPAFGSGQPTLGSFQEIILPSLQLVFTPQAVQVCNQLKVGGATYVPEWSYPSLNYYSVHYPGTDQYGGMDWETWVVGVENVGGKPYLSALVHFVWEP